MITESNYSSTIDRGRTIFEEQVASRLSGNENPDDLTPSEQLRTRHPDAMIYLRRVGDEAAYTVGGGYQE